MRHFAIIALLAAVLVGVNHASQLGLQQRRPLKMCQFGRVSVWSLLVHALLWAAPTRVSGKIRFSEAIVSNELINDATDDSDYAIPAYLVGMEAAPASDIPGLPLDPNDFNTANDVQIVNAPPFHGDDPTTRSGHYQGDILIPNENILRLLNMTTVPGRNAINSDEFKWRGAIIPYLISSKYTDNERAIIAGAISTFHTNSCVRFKGKTALDADYIFIRKGSGCSSAVGRVGGQQIVSLGDGCVYYGIVLHELMHVLGFWHEQSRPDRDVFVPVLEKNVVPGMLFNFAKHSWILVQYLSQPYDTDSVMHYGKFTFAKNRQSPTILPHKDVDVGQRTHLSTIDLIKLNLLYNCDAAPLPPQPHPPPPPSSVTGIVSICEDDSNFCEAWARTGECDINPSYMLSSCMKACKVC